MQRSTLPPTRRLLPVEGDHVAPRDKVASSPQGQRDGITLKERLARSTKWILLSMLVTSIGVHRIISSEDHSSSVTLFVGGGEQGVSDVRSELPRWGPTTQRVYHSITSSAMMAHLVERFDLGDHFGLEPGDRAKTQASQMLLARTSVRLIDERCIRVEISLASAALAAAVANEIPVHLARMMETQRASLLNLTNTLDRSLLTSTQEWSKTYLDTVYQRFAALRKSGPLSHGTAPDRLDRELDELLAMLSSAQASLVEMRLNVTRSSLMLEHNMPPVIEVMQDAVEDPGSTPSSLIWRTALYTLLLGSLAVALLLLWHFHRHEVRYYWSGLRI